MLKFPSQLIDYNDVELLLQNCSPKGLFQARNNP